MDISLIQPQNIAATAAPTVFVAPAPVTFHAASDDTPTSTLHDVEVCCDILYITFYICKTVAACAKD